MSNLFNSNRFNLLGNTYPVKDKLKAIGCKWDANLKCWYATSEAMHIEALRIMGVIGVTPSYTSEENAIVAQAKAEEKAELEAFQSSIQNSIASATSELLAIGLTQQGIDKLMAMYRKSISCMEFDLREQLENAKYTDLNKKAKMFAILEKYELF